MRICAKTLAKENEEWYNSGMDKKKSQEILARLFSLYPDARPALEFSSPYELLVAVVLSAQCTDERVNKVTRLLFKEYNTPEKMLTLSQEELERYKSRRAHLPKGKSMGCVFKNVRGVSAGKLIENSGLKGYAFGDACISDIHANFIINKGNATSTEIPSLSPEKEITS